MAKDKENRSNNKQGRDELIEKRHGTKDKNDDYLETLRVELERGREKEKEEEHKENDS
ncbi:hypothetical protein [Marinococcus sp. PL1-022]|uniref:hypothetical protein n=1 Tax=Marinococcus sp. PL1-022 TaxID=3095363 RepID=UPI0029C13D70|nr:hypothetical protein [Marinococcus sp. PL1-022]MDX6154469.1 hypothetical protein [Marinococcus sp. PL1-022]